MLCMKVSFLLGTFKVLLAVVLPRHRGPASDEQSIPPSRCQVPAETTIDILSFCKILTICRYLDENIVRNCRNVCVFANDVRQSALFYLVQHGPGEWPNNDT